LNYCAELRGLASVNGQSISELSDGDLKQVIVQHIRGEGLDLFEFLIISMHLNRYKIKYNEWVKLTFK
jgi:hypothetical protein